MELRSEALPTSVSIFQAKQGIFVADCPRCTNTRRESSSSLLPAQGCAGLIFLLSLYTAAGTSVPGEEET